MEFLLERQESGDVSVRWKRLAVLAAVFSSSGAFAMFAMSWFVGLPFRPMTALFMAAVIVLTWLTLLYFAKRRAEKKQIRQLSTRALLAGLTGVAIILAIATLDRELRMREYRKTIEENRIHSPDSKSQLETDSLQFKSPANSNNSA